MAAMRRRRGYLLLVIASGGFGCVHPILKPKDGLTTMKQATRVVPTNGEVQVAIASRLIDQPAGSDYLSRGLWRETTSPISHELTTLLAINGIRIGVLGATRPLEFQTLMTSEASVLDPMIRTTSLGRPRVLPVNGPLPSCELEVSNRIDSELEGRAYAAAECGLQITPMPSVDGRMKLRCELQIQHGQRQPFLQPSADGSYLARKDQRPTEQFGSFAWEITFDREDALIVGATEEPVKRLGEAFFFSGGGERPRQRVLVIQGGWADSLGEASPVKASRSPAARAGSLVVRKE